MKKLYVLFFLLMVCTYIFGQHIGLSFKEAEQRNIKIEHLDSLYKSAVHSDTLLAVFKTELEQGKLQQAYIKMLQDFGKFLAENNFKWEKPTKCFQRIYFNPNGTVDYFLYNFLNKNVKPEDQLPQEKQVEFDRLLNKFIQTYQFSVKANVKFAQCSPTTYKPA